MHREATKEVFLGGKNVIVVGGTAGIGEAAAITFARHGASVTVAGRNKERGENVVQKMREALPSTSSARLQFKKIDVTSMAEIKSFAKEYTDELGEEALDILILCAGGIIWGPRQETPEGNEPNFTLSYLSRFMLMNQFIPLLSRSDNPTAMSILRSGMNGIIDLDDPQLKNYSWNWRAKFQLFKHNTIGNDLMVQELGERYPNIHFFHIFPGWVSTDFGATNQLPGNFISKYFAKWFGTSPEDYSYTLLNIATSQEYKSLTGVGLDASGNVVLKTEFQKQPGVSQKWWDYSVQASGLNNEQQN